MVLLLVVIKLEGGLDTDLVVLDCPPTPPPERRRSSSNPLMSPHGDDMADLATEGSKEEMADTPQTNKDNKKGVVITPKPMPNVTLFAKTSLN